MVNIPSKPIRVSLTPQFAAPFAGTSTPTVGPPVLLESGGYILRTLTPADATPRFLEWLNSEEMMQGLNIDRLDFTIDKLRGFISGFNNLHGHIIGIFDKKTGLIVGFQTIDVNLAHRIGNITTGIGETTFQGKGVLWAINDLILDHFYHARGIEKMTARILAKNKKMLFNFIGSPTFFFEAKLKQECLAANGERLDILVFASYKTEFETYWAKQQAAPETGAAL